MEITEAQWNELCNKVSGFETKIEELTNQNAALKTANETKQAEYEAKLAEWQTKLNDQQTTIDTLAAAKGEGVKKPAVPAGTPKSGHRSVRFDAALDKYVFDD